MNIHHHYHKYKYWTAKADSFVSSLSASAEADNIQSIWSIKILLKLLVPGSTESTEQDTKILRENKGKTATKQKTE